MASDPMNENAIRLSERPSVGRFHMWCFALPLPFYDLSSAESVKVPEKRLFPNIKSGIKLKLLVSSSALKNYEFHK